jgi:hypothetical protein
MMVKKHKTYYLQIYKYWFGDRYWKIKIIVIMINIEKQPYPSCWASRKTGRSASKAILG